MENELKVKVTEPVIPLQSAFSGALFVITNTVQEASSF